MLSTPVLRLVGKLLVALGILLSMLFAGAAPSDFANDPSRSSPIKP